MEKKETASGQTETDVMIGELVLYSVAAVAILLFFLPGMLGMLLFALFQPLKQKSIYFVSMVSGTLIILFQLSKGHVFSYVAFLSQMKIPYMSVMLNHTLNRGEAIPITSSSFFNLIGLGLVACFFWYLFTTYFWKKRVTTKAGTMAKQKAEQKYKRFRQTRFQYLKKKQLLYRKKQSKENFIGYSDFKERVSLKENELNYHMLATGGTGTGKTTLIASLMEAALQQNKPIIYMDGKGERKSMLEFKKLCESYGKKVYLFSECDQLTYNPIKNGTATETRDKLLSLFTFSSTGDGAYYTDIASRYLQLIVKLLDTAGVPRELGTILKLTSMEYRTIFFRELSSEEEIEEEVTVAQEEEETIQTPPEEDLTDFLHIEEPQERAEPTGKKTIKKRKRKVVILQDGLQQIKTILDREFPEDLVKGCLTRLKMQLGELLESDLGHLFREEEDGIDLRRISEHKDVVIFSISGSRYADYIKKIGKMIILDVNSLVAYRQMMGRTPIFGVYDEFSAYGDRRIVDIVNKSRSAGFECIISTQTLSDLDSIDPVMTEQIITNCNVIATGRINSSKDAERMAKVFGTYSDREITQQIEKKYQHLRYESEMGTVREVERFKAHPSDIKNLQLGEIFINRKMIEEKNTETYFRRVFVRNALDIGGIK